MNSLSDLRDLIRSKFPTIQVRRFPGYVLETSHGDFDLGPKGFARDSVYYETEKALVKDLDRLSKLPATKADPAPGVTAAKPTRKRSERPSKAPPAPDLVDVAAKELVASVKAAGVRKVNPRFEAAMKKTSIKKPVAVKKAEAKPPAKKAAAKKKAAVKKAPPPPKGPPVRLVHPVLGELKPKPKKKVKRK